MAGMFGRVNIWQIAQLKVVGEKKLVSAITIPIIS